MDKSSYEQNIELALGACNKSLTPNYSAIAKEFNLERTTLSKRHKGQTMSRAVANSLHRQLLTSAQEEQLIKQINKLTLRQMPPTVQIVKNLAEEIIGREVNKNWTSHFVKRHRSRLKSLYLRNIDNLRAKAEYAPMFEHFYQLVKLHLYYFHLHYDFIRFYLTVILYLTVKQCHRTIFYYW
jgi:hypothetical protein